MIEHGEGIVARWKGWKPSRRFSQFPRPEMMVGWNRAVAIEMNKSETYLEV